jgi:hypothetical protein
MKTKITTDNHLLRKEFLGILEDLDKGRTYLRNRTGKLLVSVGPQTEVNGEYTFEVEYV